MDRHVVAHGQARRAPVRQPQCRFHDTDAPFCLLCFAVLVCRRRVLPNGLRCHGALGGVSVRGAGRRRRLPHRPGRTGPSSGAWCAAQGSCTAVGEADGSPLAEVLAGGNWSSTSVGLPAAATGASLQAVSCVLATSCLAVGGVIGTSGTFPVVASDDS